MFLNRSITTKEVISLLFFVFCLSPLISPPRDNYEYLYSAGSAYGHYLAAIAKSGLTLTLFLIGGSLSRKGFAVGGF